MLTIIAAVLLCTAQGHCVTMAGVEENVIDCANDINLVIQQSPLEGNDGNLYYPTKAACFVQQDD